MLGCSPFTVITGSIAGNRGRLPSTRPGSPSASSCRTSQLPPIRRPAPSPGWVVAGFAGAAGLAVLVGAGRSLGRGLTASPLPNARAELCTDGLYRHVRHPIYSAVILLSVARTVASGNVRQAAVSVALGSLLYGKSSFEERALARRFPDYPAYAARTPRFVPRMRVAPENATAPPTDSP